MFEFPNQNFQKKTVCGISASLALHHSCIIRISPARRNFSVFLLQDKTFRFSHVQIIQYRKITKITVAKRGRVSAKRYFSRHFPACRVQQLHSKSVKVSRRHKDMWRASKWNNYQLCNCVIDMQQSQVRYRVKEGSCRRQSPATDTVVNNLFLFKNSCYIVHTDYKVTSKNLQFYTFVIERCVKDKYFLRTLREQFTCLMYVQEWQHTYLATLLYQLGIAQCTHRLSHQSHNHMHST